MSRAARSGEDDNWYFPEISKAPRTMADKEKKVDEDSIGYRIWSAREEHDMSVAKLARRLGVEQATVKAWEINKRVPRANRLVMLSGVLDVSLAWLLEGEEDVALSAPSASLNELREDLDRIERRLSEVSTMVAAARARLVEID